VKLREIDARIEQAIRERTVPSSVFRWPQ